MSFEVPLDMCLTLALAMVTREHHCLSTFLLLILLAKLEMLVEVFDDLVTVRTLLLPVNLLVDEHGLGSLDSNATVRTHLVSLIMSCPLMVLESRFCLLHLEANIASQIVIIGDIEVRLIIIIIITLHSKYSLKGSMQGETILEDRSLLLLKNIIVCACVAAAHV